MVASTLKLGIAVLNGGNSTVQQVPQPPSQTFSSPNEMLECSKCVCIGKKEGGKSEQVQGGGNHIEGNPFPLQISDIPLSNSKLKNPYLSFLSWMFYYSRS